MTYDTSSFPSPAGTPSRPWYHREPWLAVSLAGLALTLLAAMAPQSLRVPMIGLGGLLTVAGIALLVRQGPFREHGAAPDGPERPRHVHPAVAAPETT